MARDKMGEGSKVLPVRVQRKGRGQEQIELTAGRSRGAGGGPGQPHTAGGGNAMRTVTKPKPKPAPGRGGDPELGGEGREGGREGQGLLLGPADDGEDVEEDVDDVGVEVERGEDVLLGAERQLLVPQDQLRVHGQELRGVATAGSPPCPEPPRTLPRPAGAPKGAADSRR